MIDRMIARVDAFPIYLCERCNRFLASTEPNEIGCSAALTSQCPINATGYQAVYVGRHQIVTTLQHQGQGRVQIKKVG